MSDHIRIVLKDGVVNFPNEYICHSEMLTSLRDSKIINLILNQNNT